MDKEIKTIDAEYLQAYIRTLRGAAVAGYPGLAAECLLEQNAQLYVGNEPFVRFSNLMESDPEADLLWKFREECIDSYQIGFWGALRLVESFLKFSGSEA